MQYAVVSMAITSFFLFVALLYPVGKRIDSRRRRLDQISKQEKLFVNDELKLPFVQRFLRPFLKTCLKPLAALNVFRPKKGKQDSKLSRSLKMAGLEVSPGEYTAGKSVLQLVLVGASVLLAVRSGAALDKKLLIVLAGVLLAVLIPSYFLKARIKARQSAIRNEMPSVMDLLVVSLEAGLGFDGAILQLYDKRRSSPLLKELARSVRDVQLGLSRRHVLKEMGERNDVQELKVLASSLIQAEQLGVSVKSVLISQAEQLRVERKQRIEAKAMKAPVKMMLPTVIFIFPVMFIILLAPAFVKIKDIF
jgi:tight adherence protein C